MLLSCCQAVAMLSPSCRQAVVKLLSSCGRDVLEMLSTLPSTSISSSAATPTSWLQGQAKQRNEIQKVFFRKPLSHYLRWRIASSSEGAIFGPRPTSDSDSLPKLCPIGLDQTSKVKGTNLDNFLSIFQLKFIFYVSTSFAIFILEIKT